MATVRRDQRGEIKIGLIIALIVLVATIYFAAKVIPVMYHSYAFDKEVEDIALRAAGRRARDLERVRDQVMKAAADHHVEEDILRTARERNARAVSVERTTNEIVIKVAYVKPIDLIVTTWNWKFDKTESHTLY
jgi:hypothetical protein